MVRRMVVLALGLVVFAAGPAFAQYPNQGGFTVDNPNPKPGSTVTVTGNCEVGTLAVVKLDNGEVVGSAVTPPLPKSKKSSSVPVGPVVITVTIPPGTAPGPHTLNTYCGTQPYEVLSINVQGTTTGTTGGTSTTGSTGSLARTGTDFGPMISVAGVLVAGGGLLVLFTRRRRAAESGA